MSTSDAGAPSSASGKSESAANKAQSDEDRLAQALIGRGLIVGEEADACRSAPDVASRPEEFLKRLVKAGSLTPNQARRVAKEVASLLHQDIPGYQLLEKLGQGSMGTVYKARQISLNRLVAVKMLHPRLRRLYESDDLTAFIAAVLRKRVLYRSADPLDALEIAIFGDGDELGWHFDNSEFSVTVMYQQAEAGVISTTEATTRYPAWQQVGLGEVEAVTTRLR